MKVSDLIKKLQELDQDAIVVVSSSNPEIRLNWVGVENVTEFDTAISKSEQFSDMIDGQKYQKNIYYPFDGNEKIVSIS